MTTLNIKMSKALIKERIQEALGAEPAEAKRRIEVCLWGLEKAKDGPAQVNALIDELGLEAFGQAKRETA